MSEKKVLNENELSKVTGGTTGTQVGDLLVFVDNEDVYCYMTQNKTIYVINHKELSSLTIRVGDYYPIERNNGVLPNVTINASVTYATNCSISVSYKLKGAASSNLFTFWYY